MWLIRKKWGGGFDITPNPQAEFSNRQINHKYLFDEDINSFYLYTNFILNYLEHNKIN